MRSDKCIFPSGMVNYKEMYIGDLIMRFISHTVGQ